MGWTGFKFSDEKPEVDPNDKYKDPIALQRRREWEVRRKQIDVEKAKLLREKLRICYINEGVNHYKNCREYALNYLESIKNIGIHVANSGKDDLGRAEVQEKMLAEG